MFGAVERRVRLAKKGFGLGQMGGIAPGDAETGGHGKKQFVDVEGFAGDGFPEPLGLDQSPLGFGVREHDQKLFATVAADEIVAPDAGGHADGRFT